MFRTAFIVFLIGMMFSVPLQNVPGFDFSIHGPGEFGCFGPTLWEKK